MGQKTEATLAEVYMLPPGSVDITRTIEVLARELEVDEARVVRIFNSLGWDLPGPELKLKDPIYLEAGYPIAGCTIHIRCGVGSEDMRYHGVTVRTPDRLPINSFACYNLNEAVVTVESLLRSSVVPRLPSNPGSMSLDKSP